MLMIVPMVIFMAPGGSEQNEPEGEHQDEENQMEPSTEPQSSRYPSSANSLGRKFPGIFADAAFNAEGMLVWLYHRVCAKIMRDNKPLKNTARMDGLSEMIHLCMDNSSEKVHGHMKKMIAMNDLSDDDRSPRFQFHERQVVNDIADAQVAYEVAMGLFGHLRAGNQQHGENEENEENEDEDDVEMEERRYQRYLPSDLSEVSDPEARMEIHHESDEDRYRRYLVSERHEVSDPEYWDEHFGQIMEENNAISHGDTLDGDL